MSSIRSLTAVIPRTIANGIAVVTGFNDDIWGISCSTQNTNHSFVIQLNTFRQNSSNDIPPEVLRAMPHGQSMSANINVGRHSTDDVGQNCHCRPTRRTESWHQPKVWHGLSTRKPCHTFGWCWAIVSVTCQHPHHMTHHCQLTK